MSDDRIGQAEALLTEVVYRSRASQAAGTGLLGAGNCGLGERAAVDLDLSEAAARHFASLWPTPPEGEHLERIRAVLAGWIERQDALDRKRNHFLRDFRQANGFDRSAYTPEQAAAYDAGLAAVNEEVNRRRREAAHELSGV